MLSPSSLGFRRLIRLAAVLPILGALFLLPAPAFAGHWALGVGYIGTGNTALTGAGPMPSNYNQVSGVDEPYNTNYDISP